MRTFGALLTTLALLSAGSRAADWCPPPSDPSPPDRSVICSLGDPTSCTTTECHKNVLFRFDLAEEGKDTTCEKGPAVGDTSEEMCEDNLSFPNAEDTESCKKFCDKHVDCKAYTQMKMAGKEHVSCYVLDGCSSEGTTTCSDHSDCRSETKCASGTSPDCLKPDLKRVGETAKWSCTDRFDEKCNLYDKTEPTCRVGTKCLQTPSCKPDKMHPHLCDGKTWKRDGEPVKDEYWEAQECDCRPLYIYAEPGLSLLCLQPDEPHTEYANGTTLTINGKQVYKVEKGNCLLYCDGHEIHRIHCDQSQSKWIDPADNYEGPFFCWHKPSPVPQCMEAADCDDGQPICNDNQCEECENDEECSAKNSDLPKCGTDTATGTCVECNEDTDCDGQTCTGNSCGR